MTRRTSRNHGFTLVELVVVLLIMAILATLAVTLYKRVVNKARMTQAQIILKHMHKAEVTFFSENERYTTDLVLLDYDPVKYDYYQASVTVDNTGQDFLGVATGIKVMTGDRWTITKEGVPEQDNAAKLIF